MKLNRRTFLNGLGAVAAAPAVLPHLDLEPPYGSVPVSQDVIQAAGGGGWGPPIYNYSNTDPRLIDLISANLDQAMFDSLTENDEG